MEAIDGRAMHGWQADIEDPGTLQMEIVAADVAVPGSIAATMAAAFSPWASVAPSHAAHLTWRL